MGASRGMKRFVGYYANTHAPWMPVRRSRSLHTPQPRLGCWRELRSTLSSRDCQALNISDACIQTEGSSGAGGAGWVPHRDINTQDGRRGGEVGLGFLAPSSRPPHLTGTSSFSSSSSHLPLPVTIGSIMQDRGTLLTSVERKMSLIDPNK